MELVKQRPIGALPDNTELNDAFFKNTRQLCRAILRPLFEKRLFESADGPNDGQVPALLFKTPLAAYRVTTKPPAAGAAVAARCAGCGGVGDAGTSASASAAAAATRPRASAAASATTRAAAEDG
jgi:hypothetical protein